MPTSASQVRESPLRRRHEEFLVREHTRREREILAARGEAALERRPEAPQVEYLPYGPEAPDALRCEIVSQFDSVELEYGALRRAAGLLDANHRGTLVVRGPDRRSFLNRMLTAELKDLEPGVAREAFWLNRKGRVDADLLLAEFGDRIEIDLDIHQAAPVLASLSNYLISEECSIHDESDRRHHLALHGPLAAAALRAVGADAGMVPSAGGAALLEIGGVEVAAIAATRIGDLGFELIMPRAAAAAVWDALLECDLGGGRRVRPVGWQAFNVARIESGTPLFNVDFGSENLPHESGVLRRRVSFTKGCYLGQEVVARLEHLGKPKQQLVGLRVRGDALPVAGAQVYAIESEGLGPIVGTVTSSTISPLLGAAPVAFAMLRSSHLALGTELLVHAEGDPVRAEVAALRFVSVAAEGAS
jgi:folate-binding protein YgfZ